MKTKSRYRKGARLDKRIVEKIIDAFCSDFTATQTSHILSLERRTINDWYTYFRKIIAHYCEQELVNKMGGEIEADESYFGPTRVRGKKGRGAGNKTIVFGLLKRGGQVYTQIIPDAKAHSILPIIRKHVEEGSEMNTDGWKSYDGLVDVGYEKHYRVHHGKNEFSRGRQHINGIESFWSFSKRRLSKFNGISRHTFYFHLKECEFRYNCRLAKKNMNYTLQQILIQFTQQLL